ncbi:MAG: DUF3352 domain-containing protein [Chlamydiota bacterium]
MKKLLAALLVLILVALAWVFLSGRKIEAPFADAFPPGAIGYAAVKGGGALAREAGNSNFWKALCRIQSVRGLEDGAGGAKAGAAAFAALSGMLGDEAAVAFYGEKSAFGASALGAVRSREARGSIRALVLSRLDAKPAGTHEGMELYAFGLPGACGFRGMYAASADTGFSAISTRNPEELVKAAIDLHAGKGKASPLLGDRNFAPGIGRKPGGKGRLLAIAWMDAEAIEAAAKAQAAVAGRIGKGSPLAAQVLAGSAANLPVVSGGGYLYRDRGFTGMVRTRFDRARLTEGQRSVHLGIPGPLGALALAPRGTIAVSAWRLGDITAAWKSFTADSNPAGRLVAGWVGEYGIDFRKDVAPWVGDEISVQLSAVQTGGLFPLPRAELIVTVKDRRAAERMVMRVMNEAAGTAGAAPGQQPWAFLRPELTRNEHRGVMVTSLSYPLPGVSPSFAFIGERLVMGLDRSSVQEIIDTAKGERDPLLADPVFAEMRSGIPSRLNHLTWIDGEGALRAGEGVVNWVLAVKRLARSVSDEPAPEAEARFEADLPRLIAAARVFRAAMEATACGRDTVDGYFALRVRDLENPGLGNPLPRR